MNEQMNGEMNTWMNEGWMDEKWIGVTNVHLVDDWIKIWIFHWGMNAKKKFEAKKNELSFQTH